MFEQSKWLKFEGLGESACPLYEKRFQAEKGLKKAVLYASAIGIYLPKMNGERVGDALFAPGFTSYLNRVQYQEYDVTAFVREGENAVGLHTANGWAVGFLGKGNQNHMFADHVSVIASLVLTYENGKTVTVASDDTWEVYEDKILFSEFYHGETVDFTSSKKFLGKAIATDESHPLIPNEGCPVREQERFSPKKLIVTPNGERVLDFGQNLAGYVEVRVKGKKGDRIVLSHAEVLDADGNFYTKNLELARCQNTYVLSGLPDVCKPSFSFQGYRYVRLDEYPFDEVDLSSFHTVALYSEMKRTGSFSCGNEKINRLYSNSIWSQRSNFIDLPTDCPQRDERVGWTGDAQVFCRTAAIHYDVERFMSKWLNDLMIEQEPDGMIHSVAPNIPNRGHSISAAWGDASTVCPWELYLAYGDKNLLRRYYPMMCGWLKYVRASGPVEELWLGGTHYGDWLASDADLCPEMRKGATQTDLVASAFFYYSTTLVIKAGRAIDEDVSEYEALASRIKAAFRKTFMKDGLPTLYPHFDALSTDRKVLGLTQTAIVLILKFKLFEGEEERRGLAKKLVEMIEANDDCMTTGFVGTPYILSVLTENGYSEKAYTLFLQEKSPSWLFSVNRGATTIWEHWDGIKEDGSFWNDRKNSFNHYSYGSVFDWVYGCALGIGTPDNGAGYREITLTPHPDRRLGFAKGSIQTRHGEISSEWVYADGGVRYEFRIPEGTVAHVRLVDGQTASVGAGRYIFYTED